MAKRRANGEGSLRQRKTGSWELTVMVGFDKITGKKICKSFSGKTQKEVRAKFEQYKAEISKGIDVNSDYTFGDWADIWYDNHKDNVMPTTQENYKYTLRILKADLGNMKLKEIKPFDVEVFLKKLRSDGRSVSCITQCRGMLYQIMHKAEANDLILKNPVRFADKMKYREPKKRKEAFSAAEVSILMEKLPKDKIGLSIRLLLGTGMRTQELLALEPRHIALDGSTIQIEQAINMQKGTAVVGTPKSRDSYRIIPVPENIRYCAIGLRDTEDKYIFEGKNKGRPCNPSHYRDKFKEALQQIPEVRVLTPHCCRHTYVSQLQALGVDLSTIQSIVGHADIEMTEHYLHVQEEVRQSAIDKFSRAFAPKSDPPKQPEVSNCKIFAFPSAI